MVLRVGDIPAVIKYYFVRQKGENWRKLHCRIKNEFAGISKQAIQDWINSNKEHCTSYPVFKNKAPLTPIDAGKPMSRCQIDLVVMEKQPSADYAGNIYKYILPVRDLEGVGKKRGY